MSSETHWRTPSFFRSGDIAVWIKPGWIPVQWSPLDHWSSSKNMMTKLRKSNQPSWPRNSVCYLCGWFTANEIFNLFFSSDLGDISIEIPLKNSQPGDLCREQRLSALVLTGKKSHGACGRFHRYYYGMLWRKKKTTPKFTVDRGGLS